MMKSAIITALMAAILLVGPLVSVEPRIEDRFEVYAQLPVEMHLFIAAAMLNAQVQDATLGTEAHRLQKLNETESFLGEARRHFHHYHSDGLTEGSCAPLRYLESPLSLLEHIWIATDQVAQIRSSIMVTSEILSPAEIEMNLLMDRTLVALEKTIELIESVSEWIVHWSSWHRSMISLPSDFKWTKTLDSEILRRVRETPNGQPMGLVYIRQLLLPNKGEPSDHLDYHKFRIAELRERFPDLVLVEERGVPSGGEFHTTSFCYRYLWENEWIQAWVHMQSVSNTVYEINYLAPETVFDQREIDAIIRSFHRL